jgi:tripartite-type tricarboxylate transporter receptor subunit TctC
MKNDLRDLPKKVHSAGKVKEVGEQKVDQAMIKSILFLVAFIIVFTATSSMCVAARPYYEGKTVRIVVGLSPGGGYDLSARAIARHLGKHIPGNPAILVDNMPGAGSLVSANNLYRVAKPDGLTIGHFNGGLFFNQLMGQSGIEFDARKFQFVGVAVRADVVAVLSKKSGITSMEKWMAAKTPVKLGGVTTGAFAPDNCIKILKVALGLPIQLVSGYNGISEIRMATEGGELAGTVGAWNGLRLSWRKIVQTGDAVVILQVVPKPFYDLPHVPLAISFAKTEEARKLIQAGIQSQAVFAMPYVLPPGTPKEQVQTLRRAFDETLIDKEFLGEAEKSSLSIDPVSGEELERIVDDVFKLDAPTIAKFKDILFK